MKKILGVGIQILAIAILIPFSAVCTLMAAVYQLGVSLTTKNKQDENEND